MGQGCSLEFFWANLSLQGRARCAPRLPDTYLCVRNNIHILSLEQPLELLRVGVLRDLLDEPLAREIELDLLEHLAEYDNDSG